MRLDRFAVRAMIAVAFALFGAAIAVAPAQATFPGGNGLIVFSSNRDGDYEIYATTASGLAPVKLTDNSALDREPSLSADGSKVVFYSDRDGDNEIYSMSITGTEVTQLTSNSDDDIDPAFSPDGNTIVYSSDSRAAANGHHEIFTMTSAGDSPTNRTDQSTLAGDDTDPDWSVPPAGAGAPRISFQRNQPGHGSEVWSMNANTFAQQLAVRTNAVGVDDEGPSFSPLAPNSITFASNQDGDFEIFTVAGANAPIQRTTNTDDDRDPAFAPDVGQIVFRSEAAGGSDFDLYRMPAAGGSSTLVSGSGSDEADVAWQADSAAPETTITAGPADGSTVATLTPEFQFASTDLGSTFECAVNDDPFTSCTSPFTTGSLALGSNTFAVRAIDVAGNVDQTPETRGFTVESDELVVTISAPKPEDPTSQTSADFTFTSNRSSASFGCSLDGSAFSACASPHQVNGLESGPHTFTVKASDGTDTATDSYNWTVDTVPPNVTFGDVPANPTDSTSAHFSFSADEPASFECSLDGADFSSCPSRPYFSDLSDGDHNLTVRATDTAGNTGPGAGFDWVIDAPQEMDQFSVRVISSRPEMVSGDDALIEVRVPATADPDDVTITVNGTDATGDFAAVPGNPHLLRSLLDGLDDGDNPVVASLDGYRTQTLNLVNHPLQGPILSGIQQSPFTCMTDLNGLGSPLDSNCYAPTTHTYRYKTTGGGFAPLADPAGPYPANGAMTTTSDGRTVPYAVDTERGVINRSVYTISTLVDVGSDFRPDHPGAGWNGKLLYFFGGGCEAGYHQGKQGDAVNPALADGYAAAQSTLNVFGNRCSDSVSAETLSMVEEHFNETYGVPDGTIGYGGSGGSMAQQMINNNYPGLLDASILGNSFPDNAFGGNPLMDCAVVDRYVDSEGWTDEQKHAVKGGGIEQTCDRTFSAFGANYHDPTDCPATMPAGEAYDPDINPTGVRCAVWDGNVNVYGIDPETGFARQPVDNVGVQYGLDAVKEGTITWEQFLDLNQNAGSLDEDGIWSPERRSASNEALRIAYEAGQINEGGAGYAYTPTIDNRNYSIETVPNGHSITHALSMRERAEQASGPVPLVIYTSPAGLGNPSFYPIMSQWIDNIRADHSDISKQQKALDNKPAGLTDSCFDADGNLIAEERASVNSGTCGALYPSNGFPRLVAGMPLADDILKCQLKPVDPDDYGSTLTTAQVNQLQAIFPDGVCDFSKPGVEQFASRDTWRAWPVTAAADTTAPDTSVSSSPVPVGAPSSVSFEFSSTETGSNFECRIDSSEDADWSRCDLRRDYHSLAHGLHRFEARSTDAAGNIDPSPAVVDFYVGQPAPSVGIDPGSRDFGTVEVGQSALATVTVSNRGDANLELGEAELSGAAVAEFSASGECDGKTLAPGESCEITLTFSPASAGTKQASLSIPSNATASSSTVAISGTGRTSDVSPPPPGRAKVSLVAKLPRAHKVAKLPVRCSVVRMEACAGWIKLSVRRHILGYHRKPGRFIGIGSVRYRIKPGKRIVKLKLKRRASKFLARRGRLPLRIKLSVHQGDGSNRSKVTHRKLKAVRGIRSRTRG